MSTSPPNWFTLSSGRAAQRTVWLLLVVLSVAVPLYYLRDGFSLQRLHEFTIYRTASNDAFDPSTTAISYTPHSTEDSRVSYVFSTVTTTEMVAQATSIVDDGELVAGPPVHKAYAFDLEKKYKLCAITKVANEAHTLPEWIEYHHQLGFDHFFVMDDCSVDDTVKVLANYSTIGLTSYVVRIQGCEDHGMDDFRDEVSDILFQRAKPQCEFVSMFDLDEFITRRDVRTQLSLYEYLSEHDQARMAWHSMGHDGRIVAPAGFLTKNYVNGHFGEGRTKMAVRSAYVLNWSFPHHPTKMVPGHEDILQQYQGLWIEGIDYQSNNGSQELLQPWYLKHFAVKSLTEYLAKRISRPRDRHEPPGTIGWRDMAMEAWHTFNDTIPAPDQAFTKENADKAEVALASRSWKAQDHGIFLYVN